MILDKIIPVAGAAALACAVPFSIFEKKASRGNLNGEPDFLLILGCRVKGDEPEETLRTRIEAAADYLNEHKNVIAIPCGGIVHTDQTKSEAQAICEGLVKEGIEESRIILEYKSTTTEENFINAKKIIDSMKNRKEPKIAFLSSEFHLLRASYIAKKAGLECECIPAKTPPKKRLKSYAREFIVFPGALKKKKR